MEYKTKKTQNRLVADGDLVSDPAGIISFVGIRSLKRMINYFKEEINRLSVSEDDGSTEIIELYKKTMNYYLDIIKEVE